jgi:hypothetical protein
MAASQHLFYSRFGVVDISASQYLHDRTHRAMANECSFLSSAHLDDIFPGIDRYASLFFTHRPQDLPEKCAAVMTDPEAHRNLARQFSHAYYDRFHYKTFVEKLDALARSVDRF